MMHSARMRRLQFARARFVTLGLYDPLDVDAPPIYTRGVYANTTSDLAYLSKVLSQYAEEAGRDVSVRHALGIFPIDEG